LPSIAEGEEKVVGLVAVEDTDLEVLAVLCRGAYTVDWGDGSAPENFATGVKGQHRYTYASLAGDPLSRGYKTVTVVITPQAGNNLTSVDTCQKHSDAGTAFVQAKWLDVELNIPNCTILKLHNDSTVLVTRAFPRMLEQVVIREHSLASGISLFQYCDLLQSVPLFDTSAFTAVDEMFWDCTLLESVPLYDTSSVETMEYMFENCTRLICVPQFDTANVTSMYSMFDLCVSLQCVPQFDTGSVTEMGVMFSYDYSLSCVPSFDTSSLLSVGQMFRWCSSLDAIPYFNTEALIDCNIAFSYCVGVTNIPWETTATNSLAQCFEFCDSLSVLPSFNMADPALVNYLAEFARGAVSVSKSKLYGAKLGRNTEQYDNKPMSAGALNEVFTNLGVCTSLVYKYVVITGCYGASDPACDRSIATAKGWTVVG